MKLRFLLLLCSGMLFHTAKAQILPAFGGSRAGTTGMQFLKIGVDARSAGLSGNFIALVNDVSALYWNPAGITGIDTQRYHFQFGHTLYWADIGISYGGMAYRLKDGGVLGLSIMSLNSGDMNVTTEFQPFGTGETFSVNNSLIGLTYAKALTDQFSFGLTGKWARESMAGIVTNNAIFDFGITYDIGLMNSRFAVSVANFGVNVQPNGEIRRLKIGGQENITEFEDVSVPAIFRIGFAFDPLVTEFHKITAIAQLNHPTDNKESFGLGAEYNYKNIFFGRMGYELGVDEMLLPAFGIGFQTPRNFGYMRFDYGFNNKTRLGSVHRFTLSIGLT
jgi:hypothetical protein